MASVPSWLYSQLLLTPPMPMNSFRHKIVAVTGGNRGLGLEAARLFVRLGARKVIISVRSTARGETAKADIERTENCSPSVVEIWELDMTSYESVKQFATKLGNLPRLDALVESAGITGRTFSLSEGHESAVTVNVISTFLLAFLALPKLKETAAKFNTRPHLTIVVSEVHHFTSMPRTDDSSIFDALDDKSTWNSSYRYGETKLLQILVFRALFNSVIKSPETYPVVINTVNPGFCQTDFVDDAGVFIRLLKVLLGRRVDVGSRTYVHAAAIGDEGQGRYLSDCAVGDESTFVRSEEGKAAGKRVWAELRGILEEIQPGLTSLN